MRRNFQFFTFAILFLMVMPVGAQSLNLVHQKGYTNRSYDSDGMQGVHSITRLLYANPGEKVEFPAQAAGSYSAYYRWYDYDTDGALGANFGTSVTGYQDFAAEGKYILNTLDPSESRAHWYNFQGTNIRVGEDVSYYNDYGIEHVTYSASAVSINDLKDLDKDESIVVCIGIPMKKWSDWGTNYAGYFFGHNGSKAVSYGNGFNTCDAVEVAANQIASAENRNMWFVITRVNEKSSADVKVKIANIDNGYSPQYNGKDKKVAWGKTPTELTVVQSNVYSDETDKMSCPVSGNEYTVSFKNVVSGVPYYLHSGTGLSDLSFKKNRNEQGKMARYMAWRMYKIDTNGRDVFKEPTLSYRVIYDIHNASELADSLDAYKGAGANFYESYRYAAPEGKKMSFQTKLMYADWVNQVYVNAGGSTPQKINSFKWYEGHLVNGNITPAPVNPQPSVAAGTIEAGAVTRFPAHTNVNEVDTVVYMLYVGYNPNPSDLSYQPNVRLARFDVIYRRVNVMGPKSGSSTQKALITDAELDAYYERSAVMTYDYSDIDLSSRFYSKPLAWNETSYGFYYPTSGSNARRNQDITPDAAKNAPYWGEYSLNRYGTYNDTHGLENFLGADNGYFYYVDAGKSPGVCYSATIEEEWCPGAQIFFSAWVARAEDGGEDPNLNFKLKGVRVDASTGEEIIDDVVNITTGDLSEPNQWQQVFSVFNVPDVAYKYFIGEVYNNRGTSSGNDFAIDNIRFYTKKPTTKVIQGLADCDDADNVIVAAVSIDYDNPEYEQTIWKQEDHHTFYYQWQDKDDNIVEMTYIGGDGTTYGSFTVDHNLTISQVEAKYGSRHICTDVSQIYENLEYATDFFFINTTFPIQGQPDQVRPMLYIANRNGIFKSNEMYHCVVLLDKPFDVTQPFQRECATVSNFPPHRRSELLIDGNAIDGYIANGLCKSQEYQLELRIYANDDDGGIIKGTCKCDWLHDHPANFGEVYSAYLHFRAEYPSATTFDVAVKGVYTDADKTILKAAPFEALYTSTYRTELTDKMPNHVTIFPIVGTGKSLEGNIDMEVCPNLLYISLIPQCIFGFGPFDAPDYLKGSSVPGRMSKEIANAGGLRVPINYVEGEHGPKLLRGELTLTDDPSFDPEVHKLIYNCQNPDHEIAAGEEAIFLRDKTVSNFAMKAGYRYEFTVYTAGGDAGECGSTNGYLVGEVVPDHLLWSPVMDSRAWHLDRNWQSLDGGSGFTPMSNSSVVLLSGARVSLPEVVDPHHTEAGSDEDYTYFINYEVCTCKNIYFAPDAMISNQHNLTYKQAWVDMKMETGHYNMVSMPMSDIVSGDVYIPKAGENAEPFGEMQACDDRMTVYPFYMSLYNQEVENYGWDGKTTITSTTWTSAANTLDRSFAPGSGVAIWAGADADSVTVRFPKAQNVEYHYMSYDRVLDEYVTVNKSDDYHRLGFKPTESDGLTMKVTLTNQSSGRYFLVGNPFMAYLHMHEFFDANPDLTGKIWVYNPSGSMLPSYGDLYATASTVDFIPPMTSFLVETNEECKSLDVYFDGLMTSLNKDTEEPTVSYSPRRGVTSRRTAIAEESTAKLRLDATHNGTRSAAVISLGDANSNDYYLDEDGALVMLTRSMTPAAIYTVSDDNVALSINSVSSVDMIPLSLNLLKGTSVDVEITASGVSDFDKPVYLYDAVSRSAIELGEGTTVTLPAMTNNEVRYYLTEQVPGYTNVEEHDDAATDVIKLFTPEPGKATAVSTSLIKSIELFDLAGRRVLEASNVNDYQYMFSVAGGIYAVRITTESGVYNTKLNVR